MIKANGSTKGNKNRFALIYDGNIIGYFGVIPTSINKLDVKSDALWWIDLVINKKYRGLGYQSIVDEYIRNRPEIKLGFPNQSAAKIHLNTIGRLGKILGFYIQLVQ